MDDITRRNLLLATAVAYGAVVALTAETVYRLTGTTPGPRSGGTRP